MPRLKQLLRPAERAARQAVAKFRRVSRHSLAAYYLKGEGIEIGALHDPLKLPWGVKVRYVDRMPSFRLRRSMERRCIYA